MINSRKLTASSRAIVTAAKGQWRHTLECGRAEEGMLGGKIFAEFSEKSLFEHEGCSNIRVNYQLEVCFDYSQSKLLLQHE
jgi:hypothetical protein